MLDVVKTLTAPKEDFYENIIQSSDDAIICKSLDGIVLTWNPAAEALFGYTAAEMIGQSLLILFPPDRKEEESLILDQIQQGKKVVHFETERLRKNHELIHVSVTISPIYNNEGQIIGASKIARDITERKLMENALAASEMRFEDLYNHAPCGYHSLNGDGLILNINHTELQWLGYDKEEVVGKMKITDFLNEKGKQQFKQDYTKFIAAGHIQDLEIELIGKQDSSRLVSINATSIKDQDGNLVKTRSVAHDITTRKAAENQLLEIKERLALATQHNGVGIWDWNLTTGELIWDESMFTLYRIDRNDFSGAVGAWKKSLHPEDRERCEQEIQACLMENKPFNSEFRVIWPSRRVRYIKAVAKIFYDETGNPIRMLGTNIDVTDQRILEEELKRQARTDYLTGVCNRRHFMERAEEEFSRTARYGNQLTLLMIDIDFFKLVNDRYGHKAGDKVLIKLAEISQAIFREVDTVGRLGGEEFAVLLKETELVDALHVSERLRTAFAEAEVILDEQHAPIRFTVSMGLATLNKSDKNIDALLNRADKALYQAKETGRNKVCVEFND
jgi:diguanylate cyclase (GGDEF)-like protein/PAS domain S-box-containing protein